MATSRGETEESGRNPQLQCHLIHDVCHMMSAGTELDALRLETSDCLA